MLTSQAPLVYAVQAFPRALAKLIYLIPDSETRLPVVENLWEEHGKGDIHKFHVNTFREFLYTLGWSGKCIQKNSIDRWIQALLVNDLSVFEYAAYLSGIEYSYAVISYAIANRLKSYALNDNKPLHYNIHEKLEWEHGEDLLKIAHKLSLINEQPNLNRIKSAFNKSQNDLLTVYKTLGTIACDHDFPPKDAYVSV